MHARADGPGSGQGPSRAAGGRESREHRQQGPCTCHRAAGCHNSHQTRLRRNVMMPARMSTDGTRSASPGSAARRAQWEHAPPTGQGTGRGGARRMELSPPSAFFFFSLILGVLVCNVFVGPVRPLALPVGPTGAATGLTIVDRVHEDCGDAWVATGLRKILHTNTCHCGTAKHTGHACVEHCFMICCGRSRGPAACKQQQMMSAASMQPAV